MRSFLAVLALLMIPLTGCRELASPESDVVATLNLAPRTLDIASNGGQASIVLGGTTARGVYVPYALGVALLVRDTTIAVVASPLLVTGRQPGSTYLIAQSVYGPSYARDSILLRVGSFASPP